MASPVVRSTFMPWWWMSRAYSGLTMVQYSYHARDSRARKPLTAQSRFRSTVRGRPLAPRRGEFVAASHRVVVRVFISEPSGL